MTKAVKESEMKLVRSRIVDPSGNQPIGWGPQAGKVQFRAEDTFEGEDKDGKTITKTVQRVFMVHVPLGGEITVEEKTFRCRTTEERAEHSAWEKEILSRGKPVRD